MNILGFGDSVLKGIRNGNKSFLEYIADTYTNKGVTGSSISTVRVTSTRGSIPTTIEDNIQNYTPDAVIINGGFNDYYEGAPLGVIPNAPITTDAELATLDLDTVLGGFQKCLYLCKKYQPGIPVFFVSYHRIYYYATTSVFIANKDVHTTPCEAGWSFNTLENAFRKICTLYGATYINISEGIMNTVLPQYRASISYADASDKDVWNATYYCDIDGVHPSDLGYRKAYVPIINRYLDVYRNTLNLNN